MSLGVGLGVIAKYLNEELVVDLMLLQNELFFHLLAVHAHSGFDCYC